MAWLLGSMGAFTSPTVCHYGAQEFFKIDEKIGGHGAKGVVAYLQRSSGR